MEGDTHFQAAFLNHCGLLANTASGPMGLAWFEYQALAIRKDEGVPDLTDNALNFVRTLENMLCEPLENIGYSRGEP